MSVIKLHELEKEYETTLIKYKQAYLDYMNSMNNDNNKKYTTTKNSIFYWGGKEITNQPVNSINDCEALCSSNNGCSGGTFSSSSNHCWIISGNSELVTNESYSDYTGFQAPTLTQYNSTIAALESQLMSLNTQIMAELAMPNTNQPSQQATQEVLLSNYKNLTKERDELNTVQKQYSDVENEYDDTYIMILHENTKNTFWIFITIIVVLITAKYTFLM